PEQRRAEGRAYVRGGREVLDRDRNAVQGPELRPLLHGALRLARPVERLLGGDGAEGVDRWVDPLDRREMRLDHFDRARFFRADKARELDRGEMSQLVRHLQEPVSSRMISPLLQLRSRPADDFRPLPALGTNEFGELL